jgi:hypothetical protein
MEHPFAAHLLESSPSGAHIALLNVAHDGEDCLLAPTVRTGGRAKTGP